VEEWREEVREARAVFRHEAAAELAQVAASGARRSHVGFDTNKKKQRNTVDRV